MVTGWRISFKWPNQYSMSAFFIKLLNTFNWNRRNPSINFWLLNYRQFYFTWLLKNSSFIKLSTLNLTSLQLFAPYKSNIHPYTTCVFFRTNFYYVVPCLLDSFLAIPSIFEHSIQHRSLNPPGLPHSSVTQSTSLKSLQFHWVAYSLECLNLASIIALSFKQALLTQVIFQPEVPFFISLWLSNS